MYPDIVYKYYSLSDNEELNEKKFKTLSDEKVYMSAIEDFNDPFDGKAFYYNPSNLMDIDILKKNNGRIVDDFNSFIRATAFSTSGIQSMSMWAHYSNNHAGYCVAYSTKDNEDLASNLFPMQYTDERLDITVLVRKLVEEITEKISKSMVTDEKTILLKDLRFILTSLLMHNVKQSSWGMKRSLDVQLLRILRECLTCQQNRRKYILE